MKLLKYNQKYSYFISNLNITSLRLDWMTDERLKDLCKLDFKNLRELIFGACSLKSIKILGNTKFEKLEKLFLPTVKDISDLENANFKGLKELSFFCSSNIYGL